MYEVAGRRRSVSRDCQVTEECVVCVVIVETKAVGGQVMSVYKAAKRIPFPRPEDPPLLYDRTWSRTYKRSLFRLQLMILAFLTFSEHLKV